MILSSEVRQDAPTFFFPLANQKIIEENKENQKQIRIVVTGRGSPRRRSKVFSPERTFSGRQLSV